YYINELMARRKITSLDIPNLIIEVLGVSVLTGMAHNTLHTKGLGMSIECKKQLFTIKNVCKYFAWPIAHKDWALDNWKYVV
ncbi:hypothetical protein BJ085DRAFT_20723, partial [Dimargaris cristalligena]